MASRYHGWRPTGLGAELMALGAAIVTATVARAQSSADEQHGASDPGAPVKSQAIFALIIGVNSANDPELPPLRYADDDAARYYDLFTALGAQTYLLARLDENTARLHPKALEAAYPPTMQTLRVVASQMALDIDRARANERLPIAYVVYAGHGSRRGDHAFLTLEGTDLPGSVFHRDILQKLGAYRTHLIVDACHAELLAAGRGPGGERFAVEGFAEQSGLDRTPYIGLLIATSVSAESHEWERIQAGVFSHEVRSGLLGAADLDGDGGVSYREIAAFIERANSAIPNERFRPRLMARPPVGTPMLLEPPSPTRQRATTEWALEIDGKLSHGHYFLEDANGVRVLEFNNAPGVSLRLRRIPGLADTFLRKEGSTTEYRVPADEPVIALADLGETETRTTSRGARHESFELLFKNSLAPEHVSGVELTPPPPFPEPEFPYYKVAEWSAAGGALTLFALAVSSNLRAMNIRDSTTVSASQAEAARRDKRIDDYNTRALALYAGGAVLTALATWLFITEE